MTEKNEYIDATENIYDENESPYNRTMPLSLDIPSFSPSVLNSTHRTCKLCGVENVTNEHNTTWPSTSPSLPLSKSPHIHTSMHNLSTTPSASPSLLPSIHPSNLITTIEPTMEVDLPSQRPSTSPSSSIDQLAGTVNLPTSTSPLGKQPTQSEGSPSVSLQEDLVFSSGSREGDLLHGDDKDEPNAGVGIGMGLLVITPLAVLVVGIIYELKRRQRRRNRNKTILPLRNTNPYLKDNTARHNAHRVASVKSAQIMRSLPATSVETNDATNETKDSVTREDVTNTSKCDISTKAQSVVREIKNEEMKEAQTDIAIVEQSVPTTKTTSESGSSKSEINTTRASVVREMKEMTIDRIPSPDEMSVSSSISEQSSESIQSMTSLAIKSTKSMSEVQKMKASIVQEGLATSQIATCPNANMVKASQTSTMCTGATAKMNEDVANLTDESRTKNDDAGAEEGASTVQEVNEVDASPPDEVSINSSTSTQSSGSVQSMTRLVIKSTKNLAEAKKSINNVDTSTDETRPKTSTTASIVMKDDAATFSDMISTLQQFFDCNG